MKVLIATDNVDSRTGLQRSLAAWGYEVVTAENGAEAWEILDKPNPPLLVILDSTMPVLTGPVVCKKIRERRPEPYTYILILAANNSRDEIMSCLEAGADDILGTPFNKSELSVRLQAGRRIIELQLSLINARNSAKART